MEHSKLDFYQGEVLLIDKPYTWTSFDSVSKIRNLIKRKGKKKIKVGHAGTLDPLATGLLLICTGKETKNITSLQNMTKVYEGTFKLGETTPSFDGETEVDASFPFEHLRLEDLQKACLNFTGAIQQFPPIYSAIKQEGKPIYKKARRGEEVVVQAREVMIDSFTINSFEDGIASFNVVCSKGTYIRSLANDFGKYLNSGAYLKSLRRTAIGEYLVDDALTMDQIEELIDQTEVIAS